MDKENSVESGWCPICGAKLAVENIDLELVLTCPRHGVMLCFLDHDPLAMAKHCDDLGVDDLEAGAAVTAAVAESSFQEAS